MTGSFLVTDYARNFNLQNKQTIYVYRDGIFVYMIRVFLYTVTHNVYPFKVHPLGHVSL